MTFTPSGTGLYIYESDFSARRAGRERMNSMRCANGRSNTIDLNWSENAEHLTLIPVV